MFGGCKPRRKETTSELTVRVRKATVHELHQPPHEENPAPKQPIRSNPTSKRLNKRAQERANHDRSALYAALHRALRPAARDGGEDVRVRVPHAHVRDPRADGVERDEKREPALVQADVREVRLALLDVVREIGKDLLVVLRFALRRRVRASLIGLSQGGGPF